MSSNKDTDWKINQSKKFGLNKQFWVDLYHLETDDCDAEYFLNIALQLQKIEAQGFINPWGKRLPNPGELDYYISQTYNMY